MGIDLTISSAQCDPHCFWKYKFLFRLEGQGVLLLFVIQLISVEYIDTYKLTHQSENPEHFSTIFKTENHKIPF